MNDELKKSLQGDPKFQQFIKEAQGKIEQLDSVDDLDNLTNKEAGEEAKIRKKAKDMLYAILYPFTAERNRRDKTTEEVREAKRKAGY